MQRLVQLVYFSLAAFTFWVLFQFGSGYWVQAQIEKKLNLSIQGDHRPDFLHSSFRIENLRMSYQQYFEVLSGNLKIRYNLLPLTPDLLHVWIVGDSLKGKVKGKLAQIPGGDEEIKFDRFEVEIKLAPQGVMLIAADIQSSVFQFKIQKSENQKGKLLT